MAANQPQWPRKWLMTDERLGERLWDAVAMMPSGAGVVFRHYRTSDRERVELGLRLAATCDSRGLTLAVAGSVDLAITLGAQLVHNPRGDPGSLTMSRSAHSAKEVAGACRAGAALIFLSPVYATTSHPGQTPLSRDEVRLATAACAAPVIALGGMNQARFDQLEGAGFYGWAGIDAWLDQIRT